MNTPDPEGISVVAHFAKDEFEAVDILALLEQRGIRAAVEREWNPAFDSVTADMKGYYARIVVLEPQLEHAQEIIAEYEAEGSQQ